MNHEHDADRYVKWPSDLRSYWYIDQKCNECAWRPNHTREIWSFIFGFGTAVVLALFFWWAS